MKEFLKELCARYAEQNDFSGTCRLERGGEVVFEEAYGFANRAFRVPNRRDTVFDTASITKIFTAAAVLQLVDRGLLSLDGRITEIVDLRGTKIPADVTVEQLLNHTSGIADDADEVAGESYSALFVDSPNYAVRECQDFLKNFAYKEPVFKSGTDARYCNCSYILLGLAIEQVTGTSYRDYVQEHIFHRAGMKSTRFCAMDGINENAAEGYRSIWGPDGELLEYRKNIYSYPPIGTPDGGAFTNGEDLSRFLRAVRSGALLSPASAERFLSPHCAFVSQADQGIPGMTKVNGCALEFLQLHGKTFCIYKDGCNDGAAGIFCYYPEREFVLSILSNQDCDVWAMRREIQKELYRRYYQ